MIKSICLLLSFWILLSGSAHAEQDDGMLEEIIKKAMISTAKGPGIEFAIKQMKGDIARLARSVANMYVVEQDIEALIDSKTDQDKVLNGLILSAQIYDLYRSSAKPEDKVPYVQYLMLVKNVLDYGKAQSEREKYFAALQTGATIASFFPFGWIAQIAAIHQQLDDAYVVKYYMDKIDAKSEENNKLRAILHEKLLVRANSEITYFNLIIAEVHLRLVAADAMLARMDADCNFKDPKTVLNQVVNCRADHLDVLYLTSVAARLLQHLVMTNFDIISMKEMDKLLKQDEGYLEGWSKQVTAAAENVTKALEKNDDDLREFAEKLDREVGLAQMKELSDRTNCLRVADREVTPVLVRLNAGLPEDPFEQTIVKSQLVGAKQAFENKCRNLKDVPARTQDHLNRMEQLLSLASVKLLP